MITVLASAKGGSGKTSLTTGLASEAAARGVRTLLVDADTQANATDWLIGGGELLETEGDGGRGVYRMFIDGDEPAPIAARSNLDLLAAGPRTQSLADELAKMLSHSIDQKRKALALVRDLLHAATSSYAQVWIDTPPSLQSPALIETFLAAADYVLVPFKASTDHAKAAYKVIEQLVRLDEIGVAHAQPIGVIVFDRDATATRLEAAVHVELERIAAYVPIFETVVVHRAAPAAAALRFHLTPHELVTAALRDKDARLKAVSSPEPGAALKKVVDAVPVRHEVAEKYSANIAGVYDEFLKRVGE